MLKPIFIVAFSGHRPSNDAGRSMEELEACGDLIRAALEDLQTQARAQGATIELLTSVAEGSDQIACEIAKQLEIPTHLILPMAEEEFLEDFAPDSAARAIALAYIKAAREEKAGGTLRVARGIHSRPGCYAEANTQMLEAADALIAVWNGDETAKAGGTASVLNQANALKLATIHSDPVTLTSTSNRLESFANPDDRHSGLGVIAELSKHISIPKGTSPSFATVEQALSVAADESSKWFRRALTLSILFHGIAALVAGIAVSFYDHILGLSEKSGYLVVAILAAVELALVGAALILMLRHSTKGTQHVWLRCRFATELMRGFQNSAHHIDPIFPQVRRHAPEWRRFALTAMLAGRRDFPAEPNLNKAKRSYIENRINDQIKFFTEKGNIATPWAKLFALTATTAAWAAVFVILGAFIHKSGEFWHTLHANGEIERHAMRFEIAFVVFFLPVALPLVAGIAGSLRNSLDFGRRSKRYPEMAAGLADTGNWILHLASFADLERAVYRTEEILLDEQIEWMTAAESGQGH